MKLHSAIKLLRRYNTWRREPAHIPEDARTVQPNPLEIGVAIDVVCDFVVSGIGDTVPPPLPGAFRYVDVTTQGFEQHINLFWRDAALALVPPPASTEIRDALEAGTAPSPALPPGWKPTPRDPDRNMIIRGTSAIDAGYNRTEGALFACAVWAAMYDAAPTIAGHDTRTRRHTQP